MGLAVGSQIAREGGGGDKRAHDGRDAGEEVLVVAVSACVGRFFAQAATDITGEVFDGTNDEEFAAEEGQLELKIPGCAMPELLFHHTAETQPALVAEQVFAANVLEVLFVGMDILVKILDCPAPSRPSPDAEFAGEMVGGRLIGLGFVEIISGDGTHFGAVGILDKELGGEAEEGGLEDAIVFEDDTPFDMGEEPPEGGGNGLDDTEIGGLGQHLDGARPVDFAGGIAASGAESVIGGMVGARTIDSDKQSGRANWAQAVDLVV